MRQVTYGALEEVDAEEVSGGDGGGERAAGEGEHGVARCAQGWAGAVGGGASGGWRQFQPIGADILILVQLVGWWSRVVCVCVCVGWRRIALGGHYCTISVRRLNSNSLHSPSQ
jgi:hypothetical protein